MKLRHLLLYLLLGNAVFYWWASQQMNRRAAENAVHQLDKRIPRLVLLGERPVSSAVSVTTRDHQCFSIGPFEDEKLAEDLQLRLFSESIAAQVRSITEHEPKSYWVYLDPLPTLRAARARVAELKQQGVDDYFIMRDPGPTQYAISLGLYNRIAEARALLDMLKSKGVIAKMDTRYREANYYWIDIQDDHNATGVSLLSEVLEQDSQIRMLDTECAE